MNQNGVWLTTLQNYDTEHYHYEQVKPALFLEENQEGFIGIRDEIHRLLELSGAVMDSAIRGFSGHTYGCFAVFDRLVELEEIKEVTPRGTLAGNRVYVRVRKCQ